MSTPTLTTIPTKQIAPSADNPRGEIDRTGEEFAGLCVSIEAVGLVQPILVAAPNGNGKHRILDGHRRYAAALEAKLTEIPAMVLPEGVSEKVARLTANIQREDFSPIAKARGIKELQDDGLTQVQAGDVLGKSERWVREYLRLLRLPEKTQAAYDARALPIESLVPVEKVAKQAPQVAEALAKAAEDDEGVRKAVGADNVTGVLDHLIEQAAEDLNKDGTSKLGCLVAAGSSTRNAHVTYEAAVLAGAPHGELKKLKDRLAEWKKLDQKLRRIDSYAYSREPDPWWLDSDDTDAAKKFGCLLVVEEAMYFTDAAWLVDRFLLHVDGAIGEITDRIEAKKRDKSTSSSESEKGSPEQEKAAKEKRRKEREAEQQKRDEIRANNLELGQRVERALRSPKLTLEEAKLLALVAIGRNAGDLGGGGLIWCYHDYQREEQLNNGRTKVSYANGSTAGEDLVSSVLAAKKPDEVLGIALRALVLTEFADQECVAESNRSPHSIRWGAAHDSVGDLVQAIAVKRDVLPDEVRRAIELRGRLAAERAEWHVLKIVSGSRAKRGVNRVDLTRRVGVTEAAIDQAVDTKHLKEHAGEEPSYTITAAGKKRLEQLKKSPKERQAA